MIFGIILLVLIILIVLWAIGAYNKLVKMRVNVDESWSQIDVQLKRRNDLIPNLVNTVKGYTKYEGSVLEKVTALRSQLQNVPDDASVNDIMKKSDAITNSLRSIFALQENYPDLKANTDFQKLMEELTNTENKIAGARQLYNSVVANFDSSIQQFPINIVAHCGHFNKREYLKTPENEKKVPEVKF